MGLAVGISAQVGGLVWSAGGDEGGRDVVARTSEGIYHMVDTRGVPVFCVVYPSLYIRVTRVLMGVDITAGTGGDVTTRE